MKKFKIFKSVSSMRRRAAMLLVLLTLFTAHALAGDGSKSFWSTGQWNVKYWTGGSDTWYGSAQNDAATIDLGVQTTLYIKESWVKTNSTGDWTQSQVDWWYDWDGAGDYSWLAKATKSSVKGNQTWNITCDYNLISNAPNKPGQNTFYMYWRLDNYVSTSASYINFTIPGFTTSSTSKSFGTSVPINTESETTISYTHHGTAPTMSDYTITGANAGDFAVRSISNSGVNVIFTPKTTGSKTATLTITDSYSTSYSTITITLTGTAVANTTTTRLYFNDYQYSGAGDWAAASALYRFTCAYTSGVYTHYNMTKCDNTEHTYYADVEIKGVNVSIDRYNHSSPYETYNSATPTSPNLSSTNPYAKSTAINGAYATNHPYNDVTGGMVYYDNSKSGITNTLYLVVGHDHNIANNKSNNYSSGYAMTNITNTKMYYHTFSATTWHDADYYGVIGATSDPTGDHNWGSSSLASKGSTRGYTAAYTDLFGLLNGSNYLATAQSKTGGALSFSKDPTLNTTQTFNYALSTDGGSTYPALTSGVNTPGQLKLESYYFTSATAVSKNADQTLSANATTYTKSKNNVAYTGTTVLTESNTRDGYTFMGWYKGNSTIRTNSSTHSFTYYPQGDSTYTARYKAHRYTINFSANDAQYSSAPVATGSTTGISNVVYDQNVTLTANGFEREGYTFAGWSTTPAGDVVYTNGRSVSNLTATDGATVTLYAQWTEDKHTITVQYRYGEEEIASDGSISNVGITTTQAYTAPSIAGYTFSSWTLPVSGVTITTGSTSTASITINATADETIIANYTPTVYNGTLEGVDGSDGTYSVVYGETTLTVTGEAPARAGYHPQGYYLYYDGTLKNYSNPIAYASETTSKELVKSAPGGLKTHTDADGKWIYTGDAPTIYIQWEANTHTLTLYKNDGTGDNIPTSVTYGSNVCTPTITIPTRAGYEFAGYWTAASGGYEIIRSDLSKIESSYFDASTSNWKYDGDVDLYAHWDPVALTFNGTTDGDWGTASNWSPACVPTSGHDVTISAEVTVSGTAAAKSVTIGSSGKVTIQPTGVLEVAGTVTNTDDSKLIINTNSSNQGALICDLTSAPTATVNMSIPSGGFHLISSPTGGAKVSSTFAGSGIYTYAWEEGKGWDRRGYYDDFTGNEAILICGQTSCTFSGILSKACGGSLRYTAEPADANAQGINMLANPLTAPIKIKELSFSGSADGCVHILENGSWRSYAPASSQAADAVIPALQGYGVIAESSGSVSFNYTNAVRNASSHNDALRAPKRATEDTPDYMTISVLTGERKIDLQLSEHAQFSERIDKGWEAIYIEGDGRFGELYAVADKKMNILATPDLEGTVLGFVPGQASSYTLSFEGDGRGYYLNDVETKKSTLIEEGNTYTFSRSDNDAARFIISRTPIQNLPTGVGNVNDGAQARKVIIDNKIYIIRGGRMYDTTGALVK